MLALYRASCNDKGPVAIAAISHKELSPDPHSLLPSSHPPPCSSSCPHSLLLSLLRSLSADEEFPFVIDCATSVNQVIASRLPPAQAKLRPYRKLPLPATHDPAAHVSPPACG